MYRSVSAARHRPFFRQLAVITLLAGTAVAATPSSALAWWPHRWWGPRVAIGVAVPSPVYVVPRERVWVPPHYNWRGRWIPGHWRRV